MSISFWPAIQQIAGGTSGSPAPITLDSQWTVVTVDTATPSSEHAELPSGAAIGDVVEVHYVNGNAAVIHAPSGESLVGGGTLGALGFSGK